jgi:tetratricopeptide (TPR) repeat protein
VAATPPGATTGTASISQEEHDNELVIRFFSKKVQDDPAHFVGLNKLADAYLTRLRLTGGSEDVEKALRAARSSLEVLPAEANPSGAMLLAQALYAAHDFAGAKAQARKCVELDPRSANAFATLGDSQMELGEYKAAEESYRTLERLAPDAGTAVEPRLARVAELHGKLDVVRRHLTAALTAAENAPRRSQETLAWCRWQLGELAFLHGDYRGAEEHYRGALSDHPRYFRAHAGIGRVLAATGRRAEAITAYTKAISAVPDPGFLSALGDLYALEGEKEKAEAQFSLVEQIRSSGSSTARFTIDS